jgi:hypothetical protein
MAEIINRSENEITIQVKIKLSGSMLEMENQIQRGLNEAGIVATVEALTRFETTGAPIQIGSVKMTALKKKQKKEYETPYGSVILERNLYQSSQGGKTYCPLDDHARIIVSSTPKFAQMISYKYASLSAREVSEDLEENHSRHIARGFVQNVADTIGTIAQATEETFEYVTPDLPEPVSTVSVSLDGTCILMKNDGYREAMTGNVSLYNDKGDRMHTIYLGAAPEHGKATFLDRLQQEVDKVKKKYVDANYIGIADGAVSNWNFLEPNTKYHILDFYHATEYLSEASNAFGSNESARRAWLNTACHKLKHEENGAIELLAEMKKQATIISGKKNTAKTIKEKLNKAITYFNNQHDRMFYKEYQEKNFPIGSGVTEAACKTLIKERLCRSAMQWKNAGASVVLALRSLVKTAGRWTQFWSKLNSIGLASIAIN